jgi:hypothetical protein
MKSALSLQAKDTQDNFVGDNVSAFPSPAAILSRLERVEQRVDAVLDEVTLINAGMTEVLAILRGVGR